MTPALARLERLRALHPGLVHALLERAAIAAVNPEFEKMVAARGSSRQSATN